MTDSSDRNPNDAGGLDLPAMFTRIFMSVTGACVLYGVWLAAIFSTVHGPPAPASLGLLLTAPIATAIGFALGTLLGERATRHRRSRFSDAMQWPLVGGIVGALMVLPFGRTLTIFGTFAVGTLAVAAREFWALRRDA